MMPSIPDMNTRWLILKDVLRQLDWTERTALQVAVAQRGGAYGAGPKLNWVEGALLYRRGASASEVGKALRGEAPTSRGRVSQEY